MRRTSNLSVSSTTSSTCSFSSGSSDLDDDCSEAPHTPPPSHMLLMTVTDDHKKRTRPRRRLAAMKLFCAVGLVLMLWHCIHSWYVPTVLLDAVHAGLDADGELVGGDTLPQSPTAVVVTVSQRPRWTVAIPHNLNFPLRAGQYASLCMQGERMRDSILGSQPASLRHWRRGSSSLYQDRTYLDVADAESEGLLPASSDREDVCKTSLTFVMDTQDASFGKTLMLLWTSYGMAQKEGRAFFIDDTRWPYGKYSSYFAPPPESKCAPPPAHHIVPCPHNARHLVVSAATAPWTFGKAFEDGFTSRRISGVNQHRATYDLARIGYLALFRLVGEDALHASSRSEDLQQEAKQHGGVVVGMHIRRGDLRPFEYQYSGDYLPLERYGAGARKLSATLIGRREAGARGSDLENSSASTGLFNSPVVLGSDDPEIFESRDLMQSAAPFRIHKAQERIHLASKAMLDKTAPSKPTRDPGSAYTKHIDENTGWEGGFYSALFYSLGNRPSRTNNSDVEQVIPEHALRVRELVGRAYLLDLAVLGQSDGLVCAVSSAACRLLGVMMGWEAIKEGRWMNVDDDRAWSWNGER